MMNNPTITIQFQSRKHSLESTKRRAMSTEAESTIGTAL